MVNFIAPIRDKVNAIINDEVYLKKVMEQGARKSRNKCKSNHGISKRSNWPEVLLKNPIVKIQIPERISYIEDSYMDIGFGI